VVIGLGKLEELESDESKKFLGKCIEELVIGQTRQLSASQVRDNVEKLAHHYYKEIKKEVWLFSSYDIGRNRPKDTLGYL